MRFPLVALVVVACWFLVFASGAPAAEPTATVVADALRGRLLRAGDDGGALVPAAPGADAALGGRRLVALYFSADWCPPCHVFTPKLVNFYRAARAGHPEFEVVFVSRDHSDGEMLRYLRNSGMPFPAVRFADLLGASPALANTGGEFLPALVLLEARTGRPLADPYRDGQYVGPEQVLVELQRRLSAGN